MKKYLFILIIILFLFGILINQQIQINELYDMFYDLQSIFILDESIEIQYYDY